MSVGFLAGAGSSPQARGTLDEIRVFCTSGRFIPAGAGNTHTSCMLRPLNSVHPRRRGEHHPEAIRLALFVGSSPQARGTRRGAQAGSTVCRFIPAGAGNTNCWPAGTSTRPVHPRRRGEHVTSRKPNQASARFIPAGAGNTRRPFPGLFPQSVHPRRRGEHERQAGFRS